MTNEEAFEKAWQEAQPKSAFKRLLRLGDPAGVATEKSWFRAGWIARGRSRDPLPPAPVSVPPPPSGLPHIYAGGIIDERSLRERLRDWRKK